MMEEKDKSNFNAPEGYFDNFLDNLNARIAAEESSIPKSDGFKAPEEYFDTLNERVYQKVQNNTKVISLFPKKWIYTIAAAAAVAIILIALPFNAASESITFENLAEAEIDLYLEDNTLDMNSYEIADLLEVDALQMNDILETSINDTEVIDYLEDTTISIDDLNIDYEDLY